MRSSYPHFVAKDVHEIAGILPVFCFHDVTQGGLEPLLAHLHRNGYRTLGAAELIAYFRGEVNAERAVVLSFDDGWRSLWTVAHPLLDRYRQRGISFLVPTWVGDAEPTPTLGDVWQGKLTESQLAEIASQLPFVSWREAVAMQHGGTMDFQSHSLTHDTVFTSETIVQFVHPGFTTVPYKVPLEDGTRGLPQQRKLALGRPLYSMAPRMTAATPLKEDPRVQTACEQYVAEHGAARFFDRGDWERQLRDVAFQYGGTGQLCSTEERDAQIRHELAASKACIESRLGEPVEHFCFPYFAGSLDVAHEASTCGYRAAHWGWSLTDATLERQFGHAHEYGVYAPTDLAVGDALRGRRENRVDTDPLRIVRLPGDYIRRLPGTGRASLSALFGAGAVRSWRRFRSQRRSNR